ncbi:MAG: tetratricopeptide repeat protein [Chloroflexi bacterium]|uniref:Tetratricopeptide repeat protein n=1 Tax=Candidatus Chlorohelix allophototropha TaxID=3003348 RepID=A0A8T7LSG1_9CHLR|nr:tetratricopeptide repeat protein [Chloroflexota bacterium]WJW66845.1 tetratricopeptide repeat protein [Chloroflexota bacterium L227-S17]
MAGERVKLDEIINQAKQLMENGEPDKAVLLCQHVFRYYPRCLEATRELGEAYTEKRLLDEADKLFTYVLAADPHDVLGYVDRGFIAYERGDIDNAIVYYERALELDPNIEQLRVELLRLYREHQGMDRPRLRLTKAGLAHQRIRDGFFSQAIDEFLSILRETPNRLDIQTGLAEAYWRNRDYYRAEQLCRELLEEQPYLIKCNLILWHIYGVRRREERAATYLEKAQALDPLYLVAERLFEDPAASDGALNYLGMLGAAQLPPPDWSKLEAEKENQPLLPAWVTADTATDLQLGLKGVNPDEEEKSTLKELSGENDWFERLLAESEAVVEQENKAQEEAEAIAELEKIRRGDEDSSFDSFFDDIDIPHAATLAPSQTSVAPKVPDEELVGLQPFSFDSEQEEQEDLEVTDFGASAYPAGVNIPIAESGNQEEVSTSNELFDLFDEEDFTPAPNLAANLATSNESFQEQPDLGFDFELDDELSNFEQPAATNPDQQETPYDNSYLENLFVEQQIQATVNEKEEVVEVIAEEWAVPAETDTPGKIQEHAFHLRDERGPEPAYAANELAESTIIPPTGVLEEEVLQTENSVASSASKEIEEMPIKKGKPEEEIDLFDWEREELPDYLRPFAMNEEEAEKFGAQQENPPIVDVSTSPARVRPRDDTLGGGDLPDWLNPGANRQSTTARPNMMDLGSSMPPSDLPNWVDSTMEGQVNPSASFNPPAGDFGLDELQPFSLEESGVFGGPVMQTPPPPPTAPQAPLPTFNNQPLQAFTPNDMDFDKPAASISPFNDDDLIPFSFEDITGQPPTPGFGAQANAPTKPPVQPTSVQPPTAFTPPSGFGDMEDLIPFNPFEEAVEKIQKPQAQVPPPIQFNQPPATSPFGAPRGFTPPMSPFESGENLDDLEPFTFEEELPNSQAGSPPGALKSQGFQDMSGMKLNDLSSAASLDNSPTGIPGFGGLSSNPQHQRPFTDESSLDDLEGLELEPFSLEGFESIPGLGKGKSALRPELNDYQPEPFMPSTTRRPREPEPEVEPGQERPLRRFSWLENRKRKSSELESEAEEAKASGSMFERMAARRRQLEEQGQIPTESVKQEEPVAQEFDIFPSFEEVERMAATGETEETALAEQSGIAESFTTAANQANPFGEEAIPVFKPELEAEMQTAFTEGVAETQVEQEAFDLGELHFDNFDLNEFAPATFKTQELPKEAVPFSFKPDEPLTEEVAPVAEEELFPLSFDEETKPFEPIAAEPFDSKAESDFSFAPFLTAEEAPTFYVEPEPAEPFNFDSLFTETVEKVQEPAAEEIPAFEPVEPFSFDNLFAEPEAKSQEPAAEEIPASYAESEPAEPFNFDSLFTEPAEKVQESAIEETPTFYVEPEPAEPFSFDNLFAEPEVKAQEPKAEEIPASYSEPEPTEQFSFDNLFAEPEVKAQEQKPAELDLLGDFFNEPEFLQQHTDEGLAMFHPEPEKPQTAGNLMSFDEASKVFGITIPEQVPTANLEEELPDFDFGLARQPEAENILTDFTPEHSESPVEESYAEALPHLPETEHAAVEEYKPLHEPATLAETQPIPVEIQETQEAATPVEPETLQVKETELIAAEPAPVADLSDYLKRLQNNPRDFSANFELGIAYMQQKEYKQALEYYATSIKLADKSALDNIVAKLQEMSSQSTELPRYHRVLGDAYMKQGHYHWALSEYSKAIGPKK